MNQRNKEKIIAVIPAHNEEKYIGDVVKKTKKYVSKVIVVDDASTDKTGEIAKKEGAIVLRHIVNLGLGGSLKTGCEAACELNTDIIVTIDGDGQHDPDEIPKLISVIKEKKVDAVFGERPFNKKMPFVKKIGNQLFYLISKYLFKIKVKDTQTGYRIFTSNCYRKIKWDSNDYAVASEILINCEKNKLKYISCEVKTIYYENQKGTTILDGIKILIKMLKFKF
jgi:glycosyltransferase involved in cell wall biosynthesis